MVYKYYSPNCYNVEAFAKEYFWFSKVSKLNDPYDSSYSLIQSEFFRKILGLPANAADVMKEYATCSFSKHNNNMALWAYYAQSFKGFCLGFDDSTFESMNCTYQARFIFQDVQYVDKLINCNNLDASFHINDVYGNCETYKLSDCLKGDPKVVDKFFIYLAFLKERTVWGNEEEMRLFIGKDFMERANLPKGVVMSPDGYKINIPNKAIKSIILGHNSDECIRTRLVEIAGQKNVPVYITDAKIPFNIDIREYYHKG